MTPPILTTTIARLAPPGFRSSATSRKAALIETIIAATKGRTLIWRAGHEATLHASLAGVQLLYVYREHHEFGRLRAVIVSTSNGSAVIGYPELAIDMRDERGACRLVDAFATALREARRTRASSSSSAYQPTSLSKTA